MKKFLTFSTAVLLMASVFAQAPEKMSYQAVIRNSSDELVKNLQIGIKISILQGSASGMAVYAETQKPTTNVNGLVSIEIGAGTVLSGSFASINWANGPYFIKTETDPAGGTNYSITVTNQLLSVPYALHAKTAEAITGGIVETDPILKGLKLTMGADSNQEVSRAFGVLVEEEGVALRGRFLFNPDGVCVAQEVQADSVGRNVKEFIRQIQAWQHASKTGEVCPAGWRPGKKTLPVNTDVEKMTGRVGDYITLEEILS